MNDFDPLDLNGQERRRAEDDAKKRVLQANEEDDLKWLMGGKRGRRIVRRLLAQAGVNRISFSTNSMTMAFNEGQRNYGNWMLSQITTLTPEMYLKLLEEGNEDVRNDGNADHTN